MASTLSDKVATRQQEATKDREQILQQIQKESASHTQHTKTYDEVILKSRMNMTMEGASIQR
jgi:hypothetical protein